MRVKLLVIVAVIGILIGAYIILFDPLTQFKKTQDIRRKSDLLQMQQMLERYRLDNGSYPLSTAKDAKLPYRIRGFKVDHAVVDWGEEFQPYLTMLPKDPQNNRRYVYFASPNGQAYWLYASLEVGEDKDMCNLGKVCISISGNGISPLACGGICNYGVSSRNVSP